MPRRWQGYVHYYMPEPWTGGFLPKCLFICSCAVQQTGLENCTQNALHLWQFLLAMMTAVRFHGGRRNQRPRVYQPRWDLDRMVLVECFVRDGFVPSFALQFTFFVIFS